MEDNPAYTCPCHEEPYIAASMDSQSFLCKDCLMSHDMNQRIAYFSDFLKDNYEGIQKLGEGGFGKVYKARNKIDGKFYAIKVLKDFDSKSSEVRDQYIKEI